MRSIGEHVAGRADQPDRTDRVGPLRVLRMRQPLGPLPLIEHVVGGEDGHGQVVRGVQGGGRADQGAGPLAAGVRARERDPAVLAEVDDRRQVRLHLVGL